MSNAVTRSEAAHMLLAADRIVILTHQFPDGDTLGSGFALWRGLKQLHKQAALLCPHPIPEKYSFMANGLTSETFEPAFICAVDVADPKLLGDLEHYGDQVDLCIDHHGTNVRYARHMLLDDSCAATAMLIQNVLAQMGVELDADMAACIYTGIATDTGCFKYTNTTPEAHLMAAEMMRYPIPFEMINHTMFDMKTRARVELERLALRDMAFFLDGRCAVMAITNEMIAASKASEDDLEGLAGIPRQIQGVWAGVTLRQKPDGGFKVSIRTDSHVNAAEVCSALGGGGHIRAAGCTLDLPLDQAVQLVVDTIAKQL